MAFFGSVPGRISGRRLGILASAACLAGIAVGGCSGSGGSSDSGGSHAVPNGAWGSKTGELDISSSTITFTNDCGTVTIPGPATEDASGNFTLTGPFPSNIGELHDVYSGHVSGSSMHLVVTDPSLPASTSVYDLTLGVSGQVTITTCP